MPRTPYIFTLAGRAARVVRNTLSRTEKPRLCFHHIPKCAGTSLISSLEKEYMRLRNYPRLFGAVWFNHNPLDRLMELAGVDVSEETLLYHLAEGPDCLFGHVPFSERAYELFGNEYSFLTILRDPVERFLSMYFYTRRRYPERLRSERPGGVPELEEFLETPLGRSYGFTIVNYLTGRHAAVLEPPSAARMARAIDNLRKFTLVGRVEDMTGFERGFQERFGMRLGLDTLNRSSSKQKPAVHDVVRRKVTALCAPDLEVYEALAGGLSGVA